MDAAEVAIGGHHVQQERRFVVGLGLRLEAALAFVDQDRLGISLPGGGEENAPILVDHDDGFLRALDEGAVVLLAAAEGLFDLLLVGDVAGLVVGLIMEIPGFWDFFQITFAIDWMAEVPMTSFKYTWIYVAYFVIMLISPRGLFGWKQ